MREGREGIKGWELRGLKVKRKTNPSESKGEKMENKNKTSVSKLSLKIKTANCREELGRRNQT